MGLTAASSGAWTRTGMRRLTEPSRDGLAGALIPPQSVAGMQLVQGCCLLREQGSESCAGRIDAWLHQNGQRFGQTYCGRCYGVPGGHGHTRPDRVLVNLSEDEWHLAIMHCAFAEAHTALLQRC